MATYIISYDLRKPGQDYQALYDAIKSYRTWARINESVWAVVSTNSAAQIRDHLVGYMDTDDRLFVIRSGVEAAWRNPRCKNEWLKKHL